MSGTRVRLSQLSERKLVGPVGLLPPLQLVELVQLLNQGSVLALCQLARVQLLLNLEEGEGEGGRRRGRGRGGVDHELPKKRKR